ncbi:MAG TPA: histidine kinase, partial [Burkholderiaceae bacterium]|nr:histidine kinase [Burkholderiaceae bacterium]
MASFAGVIARPPQRAADSAHFDVVERPRPHDFHLVLDAFRAVLALISMLLVLGTQVEHAAALELAAHGFAVYAALLLILRFNGVRLAQHVAAHWLDGLWCLLLFALSNGGSGFFVLLFFPVLFAAARGGLLHSVGIATTCAAGAALVLSTHAGVIPWLRIALMPAALLVLGPMAALLAHIEAQVRKGDSFAAELVDALDARRGAEAIVRRVLEMTVPRFACDNAVLALQARDGSVRVFQCDADLRIVELPAAAVAAVAADLRALPPQRGICFSSSSGWRGRARYSAFDARTGAGLRMRKATPAFAALCALTDRHHAVLVPAGQRGATAVWLLLGRDRQPFRRELQLTLHHVAEQIAPVLDNAMLLEQLVAATAETERARIGRDLHDSAIQPYVGLKFAIEALARRVPDDSPLARDVHTLAT